MHLSAAGGLDRGPGPACAVLEVVMLADVAGGTLPASVLALSADPSAWEPHGPSHRRSGE